MKEKEGGKGGRAQALQPLSPPPPGSRPGRTQDWKTEDWSRGIWIQEVAVASHTCPPASLGEVPWSGSGHSGS